MEPVLHLFWILKSLIRVLLTKRNSSSQDNFSKRKLIWWWWGDLLLPAWNRQIYNQEVAGNRYGSKIWLIFMESVHRWRLLLTVLIQSGSILVKKRFTILYRLVWVWTLFKVRGCVDLLSGTGVNLYRWYYENYLH